MKTKTSYVFKITPARSVNSASTSAAPALARTELHVRSWPNASATSATVHSASPDPCANSASATAAKACARTAACVWSVHQPHLSANVSQATQATTAAFPSITAHPCHARMAPNASPRQQTTNAIVSPATRDQTVKSALSHASHPRAPMAAHVRTFTMASTAVFAHKPTTARRVNSYTTSAPAIHASTAALACQAPSGTHAAVSWASRVSDASRVSTIACRTLATMAHVAANRMAINANASAATPALFVSSKSTTARHNHASTAPHVSLVSHCLTCTAVNVRLVTMATTVSSSTIHAPSICAETTEHVCQSTAIRLLFAIASKATRVNTVTSWWMHVNPTHVRMPVPATLLAPTILSAVVHAVTRESAVNNRLISVNRRFA